MTNTQCESLEARLVSTACTHQTQNSYTAATLRSSRTWCCHDSELMANVVMSSLDEDLKKNEELKKRKWWD